MAKTVDIALVRLFVEKQKTLADTAISSIKDEPEDYTDGCGSIQYNDGIKSMCDTMLEFLDEVEKKQ